MKDGEESDLDLPVIQKSPLMESFSQSSLYRRKSSRGSSFAASEGTKEEKERVQHDRDNVDEVSCGA